MNRDAQLVNASDLYGKRPDSLASPNYKWRLLPS